MAAGQTREMAKLIKTLSAARYGCTIGRTKKGHWTVKREGRPMVIISHSPSDAHAVRNAKADLKRYLDIVL
ncbi:HicA-like toxin [Streptomyces phage Abt2graduatex2]|nr:HicA-like toxin [Streptomyces phage Abt2graduatex2]